MSKASTEDYEPTEYEDGPAPIVRITSLKLDSPAYSLLRSVKVEHFVRKDHKMVIFKSTESVDSAVKALSDSKLLSAPVFDDSGQCLGFCDIRDIMQFTISVLTSDSGSTVTADSLKTNSKKISATKLADVVNYSGQNPYIPVFESSDLAQACQFLRKPHVHRAAILNGSMEVSGILSQSDILKYVSKHLEDSRDLKDLGAQSLKSLKEKRDDNKESGSDSSLSHVSNSTTVVQALTTMKTKGLSVVAVTDEHGKLVGEFSSSDLRGWTQDNFSRMLASVAEFLKSSSKEASHPNTIKIEATLKDLLALISERHCHHVWVVDSDGKPTSLISLTDVMMFITQ